MTQQNDRLDYEEHDVELSITKTEIIDAIKLAKSNKSTRPDKIPTKKIKIISEDNTCVGRLIETSYITRE